MYDVVHAVHLSDDEQDGQDLLARLRSLVADLPCASAVVAPTLPGARNGGDVIVRLRLASAEQWRHHRADLEDALRSPDVGRVVGAAYATGDVPAGWSGRRAGAAGPGVYRTLLARVRDDASADEIADFERALLSMPAHVPQIRAWRLSRAASTTGPTPWTHVWEQEYDELDGLLGAYMNHPIHWGHVDQWFDPESPLQIVRERVCHTFCAIDAPVLDVG